MSNNALSQVRGMLVSIVVWSIILIVSVYYLDNNTFFLDIKALGCGCGISFVSIGVAALGYSAVAGEQRSTALYGLMLATKPLLFIGILIFFFGNNPHSLISGVLGLMVIVPAAITVHMIGAGLEKDGRKFRYRR